jgi:hypothetical protein
MPQTQNHPAPSTNEIAQRGEAIYAARYQANFERTDSGKFVAINVSDGEATLATTAEDAVRLALEKDPSGFFHLMRVGHKAAFEAGWYARWYTDCVR